MSNEKTKPATAFGRLMARADSVLERAFESRVTAYVGAPVVMTALLFGTTSAMLAGAPFDTPEQNLSEQRGRIAADQVKQMAQVVDSMPLPLALAFRPKMLGARAESIMGRCLDSSNVGTRADDDVIDPKRLSTCLTDAAQHIMTAPSPQKLNDFMLYRMVPALGTLGGLAMGFAMRRGRKTESPRNS